MSSRRGGHSNIPSCLDASNAGTEKIMIRTVDTDVVVIGRIQFS